jgi:L-fuconolactonase
MPDIVARTDAGKCASGNRGRTMKRFDTHVHLWHRGDGNAVRIRERVPELDQDFGLEQLLPVLDDAQVDRIVLVSAAQNEREPASLLNVARQHPDLVAGVVGWLDLADAAFAEKVAALAAEPQWLGIRLPIVLEDAEAFAARPGIDAALSHLASVDAVVHVLVVSPQITAVAPLFERHPDLRIVIDHAANPDVSQPPTAEWRQGLQRLAQLPKSTCKISAFWLPGQPIPEDNQVRLFVTEIIEMFGANRIIAAGNWPVSSLAMSCGDVLARLESCSGRPPAVFYNNAARLYQRSQG